MATKSKIKRKVAKKTRSKKTAKKTAKRTTSKTVKEIKGNVKKIRIDSLKLHYKEIETQRVTIKKQSVIYISDDVRDIYQKYNREINKREKQIDKLQDEIDRKLAVVKRELGVDKIEIRQKKLMNEIETLTRNKGSFLNLIFNTLKKGAINKFFAINNRFKGKGISYRSMAMELLSKFLGVTNKSEKFHKQFEQLRDKYTSKKIVRGLYYNGQLVDGIKEEEIDASETYKIIQDVA